MKPGYIRIVPEIGPAYYLAVVKDRKGNVVKRCGHRHERPYLRQPFAPHESARIPAMECARSL